MSKVINYEEYRAKSLGFDSVRQMLAQRAYSRWRASYYHRMQAIAEKRKREEESKNELVQ